MADYHPLDVRYKGPSTAYRGSQHKEVFTKPDFDHRDLSATPKSAPSSDGKSAQGPWGNGPPPLPDQAAKAAPPPLPRTPRTRSGNPALRRVLIGAVVLILFVIANSVLSRSQGLMSIDLNDVIQQIETETAPPKGQTL